MSSCNSIPIQRFNWIDQTKGLAILGIVLFHFFQNYPERQPWVVILDHVGAKIGLAAVDLFFVIAGFNISYSQATDPQGWRSLKTWKTWLIKRIKRLYPTYILAVVCSLLLYEFLGRSVDYKSLEFVLSFWGWGGYLWQAINPGFWFFTVLLQAYLVTPILYWVCHGDYRRLLMFGILAGILTKILCLYLEPGSKIYLYFLNTNFLGSYIFQFCLGLYWGSIYQSHQTFRKLDFLSSLAVFVAGVIIYTGLTSRNNDIVYMQGFDLLLTPFLLILCNWVFNQAQQFHLLAPVLKTLSLFGIYSYPIYLLHQPLLLVILPKLVNGLNLNSDFKIFIALLLVAILLILYTISFNLLYKVLRKPRSILLSSLADRHPQP